MSTYKPGDLSKLFDPKAKPTDIYIPPKPQPLKQKPSAKPPTPQHVKTNGKRKRDESREEAIEPAAASDHEEEEVSETEAASAIAAAETAQTKATKLAKRAKREAQDAEEEALDRVRFEKKQKLKDKVRHHLTDFYSFIHMERFASC